MPFHTNVQSRALLNIFISSLILTVICSIVYLLIKQFSTYSPSYYCDAQLCDPGDHHIGCHPPGFSFACISPDIVTFRYHRKSLTLKKHNELRNKLAAGDIVGFKSASRMRIVTWNDELAYLAYLNTQKCIIEYDQCRNTKLFRNVGQNIAISGPYDGKSKNTYDVNKYVIPRIINLWFDEYKNADQGIIDSYEIDDDREKIENFANIVNENTTEIGCGVTGFISNEYKKKMVYLLTCNYNYSPYPGLPIYTTGPAGSKCKKGRHKSYKALCRKAENSIKIDHPHHSNKPPHKNKPPQKDKPPPSSDPLVKQRHSVKPFPSVDRPIKPHHSVKPPTSPDPPFKPHDSVKPPPSSDPPVKPHHSVKIHPSPNRPVKPPHKTPHSVKPQKTL